MRPLCAALCLLLLGLLAACGEKEERVETGAPDRIELMLDYFPNADHAGIYAAEAGGHFRDVGLDVRIRQPADPAAPLKQAAAGRVELAVSYEPELLRARDRGLRVVSVAALVQEPLTSLISLPEAGIRTPADLAGKTVGTAGIDYQAAYLRTIVKQAGLADNEVRRRDVGFNLSPALITGRVDAVLGAFWNYEGTELQLRGRNPRIIRMERAGVPSYNELIFVTNSDALAQNGDRIRRFLGAVSRGTRDLERRPDDAIRGLLEANPDLDPRLQRAVVRRTLPLFMPDGDEPYGYQDPQAWERFTRWMSENDLLERTRSARGAFTNDLLPGAGL